MLHPTELNKKGQGIGLNVVVIAAIALLVLIVIAALIMMGVIDIRGGLEDCRVKGGVCSDPYNAPAGYVPSAEPYKCPDQQTCYVLGS